ncbi:protein BIC1 [Lotus japonicus]|uniref:protein BIC1 n=1 Tax=Lotus japonicus TaxID=34305 RepID=UPI0025892393|nr:protein BIC1 [Lotus japonicus]
MKEKKPPSSMAHHQSSADQIPHQPLELHQPKDNTTTEKERQEKDDASALKTHFSDVEATTECSSGRERLKRHRVEVAGRVWIPDIWGHEKLLKDWIDCAVFDAPLVPTKLLMARQALVQEGRRMEI